MLFSMEPKSHMFCHTLSPSALVTGNVSDDGHSPCVGPGVRRCGADPETTRGGREHGQEKTLLVLVTLMERVGTFKIFFFLLGQSQTVPDS